MNFAKFSGLNASKFPKREFIIETYPSKGLEEEPDMGTVSMTRRTNWPII